MFWAVAALGVVLAYPVAAKPRETQEERIEQKREAVRENLQQRAEELSGRLAKNKQEIAVRIAANMNTLNKRLTGQYSRHVQRLGRIVDKIEGRNTGSATAAITEARGELASAQAAIDTQAQKVYEINLAQAEQFGQAVRDGWRQFTTDHRTLRQGPIKVAKEAVQAAFQALRP